MRSNLRWHPGVPVEATTEEATEEEEEEEGGEVENEVEGGEDKEVEGGKANEVDAGEENEADVGKAKARNREPSPTAQCITQGIESFNTLLTSAQRAKAHHRPKNRLGFKGKSRRRKDQARRKPARDSTGVKLTSTPTSRALQKLMRSQGPQAQLRERRRPSM
ncbi:hypothetical protein DVH05_022529 [Phytophthora capsici]|nr:hypothetical protein DVH05_022529 [Phytophthora capsici]